MAAAARHYDTILAPVITEKATMLSGHNRVIFRVAPDATCEAQPASGAGASWDTARPYGSAYHWYWYRGSSPIIGSYAPHGGSSSAPSFSGTSRGGFGSTAAGHSGGGS